MGTAERREREKQQRQKDIIDAAEKVFFSKGLQHATMDDVANEVELSKGTLYLYFKNKEELYMAITLRGLQILTNMFEDAVLISGTGLEKSLAIGRAFYQFSIKYPNYFYALSYYELMDSGAAENSEIVMDCSHSGMQALDVLIQVLEQGVRDGSIKPDINPSRVAVIMWGMASGMIQLLAMKGKHLEKVHGFPMNNILEESYNMLRCALEKKQTETKT